MSDSNYKFISWVRIVLYSIAFVAIVMASYCSCGKLRAVEDKGVFVPGGLWPGDWIPHPHIPDGQEDYTPCDEEGNPLA